MIPGSKSLNPHELAHKWVKDFGTRPRYEHKSGASASRYANIGGCGLWECAARNNPLVSQNPQPKSLTPHELAHKWGKDFGTRPRYEHKSGASASRYANIGGCGLWECAVRNNPLVSQNPLLKNRGYNMLKFILFLF